MTEATLTSPKKFQFEIEIRPMKFNITRFYEDFEWIRNILILEVNNN